MPPLAAVATLALHGRTPAELPPWCDVVDHLVGGGATPLDPPPDSAICDLLGPLYELMLADAVRRSSGVHFTRPALADGLVALATSARDDQPMGYDERIVDPACGAGAFLLAAARFLATRPASQAHPAAAASEVLARLVGADLDPDVLVVARASLARWALDEADFTAAGGATAPPEPKLVCCDPLTQPDVLLDALDGAPVGLVVGNPPFLAQLRAGTRHDADRRALLAQRFGSTVGAYTDVAALFLLAATELVGETGAVCLIQPRSVLAARDATGVRSEVSARMHLAAAWVGDGGFDAAVEVWAPVLVRGELSLVESVRVVGGPAAEMETGSVPSESLNAESWGALVAAADGLPVLRRTKGQPRGRLGDVAQFSAGFRDEYYAMAELAQEAASGGDAESPVVPEGFAALVSSGLIDPAECAWGRQPMRFAKRRWQAPVVRLGDLSDERATSRWAWRQLVPKVLVASQTRVIEAAPDGAGQAIGLTPVIAGIPNEISLAHLLAVLCSPVSTLRVAQTMAGSGMGRAGVRVSAKVLADLDLPVRQGPWDDAAGLLESGCRLGASIADDTLTRVRQLMIAAADFDDPDGVRSWFETLAPTASVN